MSDMTANVSPSLLRRSRLALMVAMAVAVLIAVIEVPHAVPAMAAIPIQSA